MLIKKAFDNKGRSDFEVFENLKKNKNITIKEADNGNAIVLMDMDHYNQ